MSIEGQKCQNTRHSGLNQFYIDGDILWPDWKPSFSKLCNVNFFQFSCFINNLTVKKITSTRAYLSIIISVPYYVICMYVYTTWKLFYSSLFERRPVGLSHPNPWRPTIHSIQRLWQNSSPSIKVHYKRDDYPWKIITFDWILWRVVNLVGNTLMISCSNYWLDLETMSTADHCVHGGGQVVDPSLAHKGIHKQHFYLVVIASYSF